MNHKNIICHECKQSIDKKDDLAVVGNAFITYHNECFERIKHKNIYAFYSGYKINGLFPWFMLVILNSLLWVTYYFYDTSVDEVITFSILISSVILLARFISYLLYERYMH